MCSEDNQLISQEVREHQRLELGRSSLHLLEQTEFNNRKSQDSPRYVLVIKNMS